jgi:hypothetical protein
MLLQEDRKGTVFFFYMAEGQARIVLSGDAKDKAKLHEQAKVKYKEILANQAALAEAKADEETEAETEVQPSKDLDLSELTNVDSLSKGEKSAVLFDLLEQSVNELSSMVQKGNDNLSTSLNKKLATGRCFVKDDILFMKDEDGEVKPVWFPKGNAMQWQLDQGILQGENGKRLVENVERLHALTEFELKNFEEKGLDKAE